MVRAVDRLIIAEKLETRPGASHGLWMTILLPISIILSYYKNIEVSTEVYKLNTIFSFSFLVNSIILISDISNILPSFYKKFLYLLMTTTLATVLKIYFYKGWIYMLFWSFFVIFSYKKLLFVFIKLFPRNFTVGEASICAQALIMFIFSSYHTLFYNRIQHNEIGKISTTIIQIGLLGIGFLCLLVNTFKIFQRTIFFYVITFLIVILFILLPLQIILRKNPIVIILELFLKDKNTMYIFAYWLFCCILATLFVNDQIKKGKKASTGIRKSFHFLAVAVYLPGLLYSCNILYLASGVVFGIFISLEILRILNINPLGPVLQEGFLVYSDEKDVGIVALTPIYLLVACSLPLWIHPEPCDILDSAGFNLLPLTSGILTIGIGDSAASIVGTKLGKHRWPGSRKTLEGTLACIVSQIATVFLISKLGYAELSGLQLGKVISGVIFCSYVEAVTDQIDNLVLPFIMYIFLV